jgi:hypothetical protein
LAEKKAELAPEISESEFFEIFVAEQLLKNFDLSYEELEDGVVDSSGDGGVDSFFLFVNGELIRTDANLNHLPQRNVVIDLFVVQSKTAKGFSEDAMDKLAASAADLFDLAKDLNTLKSVYNSALIEKAKLFRDVFKALVSKFPTLKIRYVYAAKSNEVHPNVERKVDSIKGVVGSHLSSAQFDFDFLTAKKLLDLARSQPTSTIQISVEELISTVNNSYICLISLIEFFSFIQDESKQLKRSIFESNVRDYQGSTAVNEEIQDTLKNQGVEDFWWLNNGVTIVASQCTEGGKKLTLEDPQIVNGLQTSNELFKYFKAENPQSEKRRVLVRVIVVPDSASRDRIIKATNSQTNMTPSSLRATDPIHRNIEEFFRVHGLYYDRRKNSYKNENKPINKIVSISELAQAVLSVVHREPHLARSKPSSLVKKDEDYKRIFSDKFPLNTYLVAANILKVVDRFIKESPQLIRHRTNLKFALTMYVALKLSGVADPSAEAISQLNYSEITKEILENYLSEVKQIYDDKGATDGISKSADFTEALKKQFLTKSEIARGIQSS